MLADETGTCRARSRSTAADPAGEGKRRFDAKQIRMPLLSIQQLSYTYPSGQVVLREINLSLGLRERVGIVGPNGAGKTTLLLHLNGLLPEHRAVSETVSGMTAFCVDSDVSRHSLAQQNRRFSLIRPAA